MGWITGIGIFLVLWGILALAIGIMKPQGIWKLGKIQGFVQLLGETGTVVILIGLGAAAIIGGVMLLL